MARPCSSVSSTSSKPEAPTGSRIAHSRRRLGGRHQHRPDRSAQRPAALHLGHRCRQVQAGLDPGGLGNGHPHDVGYRPPREREEPAGELAAGAYQNAVGLELVAEPGPDAPAGHGPGGPLGAGADHIGTEVPAPGAVHLHVEDPVAGEGGHGMPVQLRRRLAVLDHPEAASGRRLDAAALGHRTIEGAAGIEDVLGDQPAAHERVGSGRVTPEQVIPEQVIPEQVIPEQVILEQVILGWVGSGRVFLEWVAAEQVFLGWVGSGRVAAG